MSQSILFITGATASGKTDLSLEIAGSIGGEIINLDTGQMYEPLNIGVAKPDWQKLEVKHHLFDIAKTPVDISAQEYSKFFSKSVQEIFSRNKIPIVVGGSFFYLKSLFFPLKFNKSSLPKKPVSGSWHDLFEIDPERAKKINPNDEYRINRALSIFESTGLKPSRFDPHFDPEFNSIILFIDCAKEDLVSRIHQRTYEMIVSGWIDEVVGLRKSGWEDFIRRKGFIGYEEIFNWLDRDDNKELPEELISKIVRKTRKYAKRQMTFWRSLKKLIENSSSQKGRFCHINDVGEWSVDRILSFVQERFSGKRKG
jgi:tRNA dimethylallyltransferase